MTLRDDMLSIISNGWALAQSLGVTQYTITIRTRTWSGGKVQSGTPTVADATLSPNPWVEERDKGRELVCSGITPSDGTIGYTPAQLNPSTSAGVEFYYIATGPNGTHSYALTDLDSSDAFEYKLTLTALTRALPF